MTATIYWTDRVGQVLPVAAPQAFISAMDKLFGPRHHGHAWVLTAKDCAKLEVADALCEEDNPFRKLLLLIEEHPGAEIQVWAEY